MQEDKLLLNNILKYAYITISIANTSFRTKRATIKVASLTMEPYSVVK